MNRTLVFLMALAALALGSAMQPAHAGDNSFHAESDSYRVYLGVVPAGFLKKNPGLVDQDKQLHGGASAQSQTAQHVMVTVFRKNDNARVIDATVIATVGRKKVFGGRGAEKPLEKMVTSGAVAYGNFFDMPERAEYRIALRIYQPHKDGNEKVDFVYGKY